VSGLPEQGEAFNARQCSVLLIAQLYDKNMEAKLNTVCTHKQPSICMYTRGDETTSLRLM
jgi:hypothetical protein